MYASSAVLDVAAALQGSRGEGDAGATGAEHFSEKLLCQHKAIRFKAVPDHQQPAGETFIDLVKAMAGCELAENEALALHTFHDALSERGVREEELLQFGERHAQGGPFTLDEGGGGGGGGSQEVDRLNEAFTANHADFGSDAVGHEGDDGCNAGGHEVGKRGRLAGVGEDCSDGQVDRLQAR